MLALLVHASTACAQGPGSIPMTPHRDVELKAQRVMVPEKFRGRIDTNHIVYLPDGWSAKIFYMGQLSGTRFITWGPDSVLYVTNPGSGRILALPDRDHDGVADTAIVVATNANGHDMKFFNGALYVAETDRVQKLTDVDGDGFYEKHENFIPSITGDAQNPGGGHSTRTIVFDPVRQKLYLSIGSSCNVCRDEGRAQIQEFNLDGTGRRTYADGIRNAVGMTLHPRTGRLWATNNGNDNQGDDRPAEWIDLVRDGGFYGWPFAHSYQFYNDFTRGGDYQALLPITAADSARVRTMVSPAALVQAHSALMAIEFPNSDAFPEAYRHGAFIASHGSWNRSPQTGYKVMYLDFSDDNDTVANTVSDFLTGFQTDSGGARWARPVGLETDARGNLYMSSDAETVFIMIVSPSAPASAVPSVGSDASFSLGAAYPNPTRGEATIGFSLKRPAVITLTLLDVTGREVRKVLDGKLYQAGAQSVTFDIAGLPSGSYIYRLGDGISTATGTLQVVK
jgi:glucose/arabinose dehydrogenase